MATKSQLSNHSDTINPCSTSSLAKQSSEVTCQFPSVIENIMSQLFKSEEKTSIKLGLERIAKHSEHTTQALAEIFGQFKSPAPIIGNSGLVFLKILGKIQSALNISINPASVLLVGVFQANSQNYNNF